ncbi:hypothetical protein [Curtobacterium sp. MCBA15_001]|uniref:hypothetical protein n=1 Tax=Curtobacterium sp. MCBA15_001 TaxID=1898731 RepID=UPI0008DCBF7D|nr:hypothetical protein [Curtobacterium sp. MCBA15_001]OIH94604.1 hypothetical protein BIU90_05830 [Curtobacterium sp. MCBA15_001]
METTIEYAVHTGDRRTAMELAGAALRSDGHRVDALPGSIVAEAGSRLLTVLLGALVHPGREYRRYELVVSTAGGRSTLTLRHADHGPAVAGGTIGAARRQEHWRRVTGSVERSLRSAGLLVGRVER